MSPHYPNMSHIVDADVNDNVAVLANLRGRISVMVWMEEPGKLMEKYCYNIGNQMIRDISFIHKKQSKLLVSDESNNLYVIDLKIPRAGSEVRLAVTNVIKLDSQTANIVNLENWKGIQSFTMEGGSLEMVSCKLTKSDSEELVNLHKKISL